MAEPSELSIVYVLHIGHWKRGTSVYIELTCQAKGELSTLSGSVSQLAALWVASAARAAAAFAARVC